MTDTDLWKVENVLKTKGKGRNKQYFVKWLHWPSKFNSWVKATDVHDIQMCNKEYIHNIICYF